MYSTGDVFFKSEYLNLDKNGKVVALKNNGPQGEIVFR